MKCTINSFKNLREILPQSQSFIYQALVESHLRYRNLMYCHLQEKILCSLQTMQNRVLYLNESAPMKDQVSLARYGVEKAITYDQAIMVHKALKQNSPENLQRNFMNRAQISKYETLRMSHLQIPRLPLEISFSLSFFKHGNSIS